jgi:hypothetical protein
LKISSAWLAVCSTGKLLATRSFVWAWTVALAIAAPMIATTMAAEKRRL